MNQERIHSSISGGNDKKKQTWRRRKEHDLMDSRLYKIVYVAIVSCHVKIKQVADVDDADFEYLSNR